MRARILFYILIGFLIGLWEVVFYPFLPAWLAWRPLLPAIVLTLVAAGRAQALALGLTGAFLLSIYPISSSDFPVLRYLLVILVLDALLRQWLTNRSLYASFGLVLVGRGIERLSAWLMNVGAQGFGFTTYGWSKGSFEGISLIWDLALIALGFFVYYLLTRRRSTSRARWEQTDFYGLR